MDWVGIVVTGMLVVLLFGIVWLAIVTLKDMKKEKDKYWQFGEDTLVWLKDEEVNVYDEDAGDVMVIMTEDKEGERIRAVLAWDRGWVEVNGRSRAILDLKDISGVEEWKGDM